MIKENFDKDIQYYKFCLYGFLKNLRFFEPFFILFLLEKGLSFLEIGSLYAIREILINIFEIPSGIIADTLGRRKTLIVSFIFYVFSFIVFYVSEGYMILLWAIILFSFGDAFRSGSHKAMIFEYLKIKGWKDYKVHYYGHTRSFSQLGSAISAIIAAFLVFFSGDYNKIFLYSIIPYILDILLMMSYPKELDGEIKAHEKHALKKAFLFTINNFIISIKSVVLLKSILNTSIYSGFYKGVKDYIQPLLKSLALSLPIFLYIEDKQRTAILIGIVYFILFIISSLAARNSGRFSTYFPNLSKALNITLIAGLLSGVCCGFFYDIGWYYFAILFFIDINVFENIRKPIGVAIISEISDSKIHASVLSANSQVKTIFASITALLIGCFSDIFGVGNAIMLIAGLFLILVPFVRLYQED